MTSKTPTHFGLTVQKEMFSEWYTQVLQRSDFLDSTSIRGFTILRTSPMFAWREIQDFLNARIKERGVDEFYFPMVVTQEDLMRESAHIESFEPEVAWITKSGTKDIAPLAVRPTSEAIVYPFFKRAIRSHRDLPFKINQWCNILRWEVKSTVPLIRGREFLWQEGHCAYLTEEECKTEVRVILGLYEHIYTNLLAVPVIAGKKTESEKFGGAEYTLTVEAFIKESGRAVQGATSHNLGTNFAKMFDVKCDDFVFQSSWGITTRSIGVAVMTHGDDTGLVLPPRVAHIQVVIIPCGKVSDELRAYINSIVGDLKGLRVHVDWRDHLSVGYKLNHWEIRGIPLRIEVGKRDMEKEEMVLVTRHTLKKSTSKRTDIKNTVSNVLDQIHNEMYDKAKKTLTNSIRRVGSWSEFLPVLNEKNIILMSWCGSSDCEEEIKKETEERNSNDEIVIAGAKTLCIPFEMQDNVTETCLRCGKPATENVLFGRSY